MICSHKYKSTDVIVSESSYVYQKNVFYKLEERWIQVINIQNRTTGKVL